MSNEKMNELEKGDAAQKRMDDALKRALSTPPKPRKPTQKKSGSKAAVKPRRMVERDGS